MNRADSTKRSFDASRVVAESGLLTPGGRTLVMLSGGGDSVALLAAIAALEAPLRPIALHVNYGLRGSESDADEALCERLCGELNLELFVKKKISGAPATGNLHDWARGVRYELAEQLAEQHGCSEIAVAHTADDQAETILYRLFASPGRRALLGMQARRGKIVRPLLTVRREQLREWSRAHGLEWREDASNEDERFARARVRSLLAQAEAVHPAAVENILRSARQLRAEDAALSVIVGDLLAGATDDSEALRGADLAAMPPALAGLVLREHVERQTGVSTPGAAEAVDEAIKLSAAGGSHTLELAGAKLAIEYGLITVAGEAAPPPPAVALPLPGRVEFGEWRISAGQDAPHDAKTALIRAGVESDLTVRTRIVGDRIRPSGMDGSKTLHDLFIDRKVPRRLRDSYPVVCAGERIVWVPGLAVDAQLDARGGEGGTLLAACPPAHLHSFDRGDDR